MANDYLQRTPDWFKSRLGKFSSSTFGILMGNGRSKDSVFTVAGKDLIMDKLIEIYSEQQKDISGDALDWGTEYEESAIKRYERLTGNKVIEVGFVPLEGYEKYAGGSPDGLVGEDGIIEVKCPYNTKYHIETILNDAIPKSHYQNYYTQIQMNMMINNRKWCDFISYDPRMKKDNLKMKVVRYEYDEEYCNKIKERLDLSIKELNKLKRTLNKHNIYKG